MVRLTNAYLGKKHKAGTWEIKSSTDNIPCGIGLYDNGTGNK